MNLMHVEQEELKYHSSSRGGEAQAVQGMHWKHLSAARRKLLERWAQMKQVVDEGALNLSPIIIDMFQDPGTVFPVYNTLMDEMETRQRLAALSRASKDSAVDSEVPA